MMKSGRIGGNKNNCFMNSMNMKTPLNAWQLTQGKTQVNASAVIVTRLIFSGDYDDFSESDQEES